LSIAKLSNHPSPELRASAVWWESSCALHGSTHSTAYTPEPDELDDDDWFRDKLIYEIERILDGAGVRHEIIPEFGLDVGVFVFHDDRTACKFLEAKTSSPRKGRVGMGNRMGKGTQVDLLLREDDSLRRLRNVIMWILGDSSIRIGEKRYAFFDCIEAKESAYGGVQLKKQNNLNVTKLLKRGLTWDELSDSLKRFLLT